MAVPVSQLLRQHSTNPVQYTGLTTNTDKKWAKEFHPITRLIGHTTLGADGETVYANFDAMAPPLADDDFRVAKHAFPPNERRWRLETEEDCGVWFHTEVSNIVLPAWNDRPAVLQTCQSKPASTTKSIKENVDMIYALADSHLQKRPLVIGEWKRNIIRSKAWLAGNIGTAGTQVNLSRELLKYSCPHVFCFDGQYLLLLQFRAATKEDLKRQDCEVDCWVIPRINTAEGCTLRYAFYRFLAQGFRRCQGLSGGRTPVNGFAPHSREWFSGIPIFQDEHGVLTYTHPQNTDEHAFYRELNVEDGWEDEFENEKAIYQRLAPVQGTVVPVCYGEASCPATDDTGPRALVLSDIGGIGLYEDAAGGLDTEHVEAMLLEALRALTNLGVTHDDSKLDNFRLVREKDRIMVIDFDSSYIMAETDDPEANARSDAKFAAEQYWLAHGGRRPKLM
ncbi:a505a8da-e047-4946-99ab-bbf81f681c51 [Thermothielavioides terrestris]|uniref:A505a8da-e047-4946-99ab-bbf81f681c51 n=1 Tax=Thermothielavioides terrestris TaxID=2587410 RepID=A0A446BF79_9PEZI|nr:a505a8da-e047-4946-99ab-bbf81f681c51 [Thermothielavioides terrestris]